MICACGSEQPIHLANIDRFGLPIDSYLCGNCGLIYSNPVLSSNSLKPFYEDYYHLMHFGSPPSPEKTLYAKGQGKKIYKHLNKYINGNKINVLEIGSGSGSVIKEFSKEAIKDGFTVKGIGLEYSKEYAECFNPEELNLKIQSGDLYSLDPTTGPYDVIIMSHVFEHFLDPQIELTALKKFLDKGTLIYIEVPGVFSLKYRYEYNCDYLKYFTFAHIYNFNLMSLTNLLNQNGFGLLWGNEEIESVFISGEQNIDTSDNAKDVINYLRNLEMNMLYYSNLPIKITDNSNEIKKIKSDMEYVKSFVDKIVTFYPVRVFMQFRKFLRNK